MWETVRVLGTDVDSLTLIQATDTLCSWLEESATNRVRKTLPPCRYVVTPNLDHAVQLRKNEALRSSYEGAAMVVADGMPLLWAARLLKRSLPERVAGSDLVPALLNDAPQGTRLFMLGASEESAATAAKVIQERYPHVALAGRLSPPKGFEKSEEWTTRICSEIRESEANLLLIGLGAPKQELWIAEHADKLPGVVALCAGATIDFFAGTQKRAPVWAQKSGLEWAHRMLSNPRRLAGRYAKDAVVFPALLAGDVLEKFSSPRQASGS